MLSAKKFHLYEEVQRLHQQYGDFVRLGPSELSVIHPGAVSAIHSPKSACSKGPWYNVLHPMVSLQTIRSKPEHVRRRKVWDPLRDYEPRVTKYTTQLLARIEERKGKPMNVTEWFNFYSFDVMGDLAFGKSFGMLEQGVKHYFMISLHEFMKNIGLFSHMLWLLPIFKATPILNSESNKFWQWVNAQVDERKKMKPDRPDVFSWLLEDHEARERPSAQEELNLIGDAYTIAVAGRLVLTSYTDTTAGVLTCLFFQLAVEPRCLRALQEEVDTYFGTTETVEAVALSKLQYLDAVINETMRLHPPVPSGVQRMTPPEGLRIGDTFIPGDAIVQIPYHTIFRDERNFEQPDDFIPERWTTRKELVRNAAVFVPFSIGRYSCIGKQLGLMEIRYVVAQVVRRYNVELAPAQTLEAFLDSKKDTFTLALGPLDLVFTPRK
ncbi:hypothetical protein H2199_000114 [Coniosporium tulheliwenetii]|uniref:Uncharacterized protein n=1 Tax=Coniosporium tulheliwenetii TaxID=3383036 RepID=A0ACC2ZPF9_9PEZI|nr:hypothetical protein H2199_000114 [Cladosporium sp. JES 115]